MELTGDSLRPVNRVTGVTVKQEALNGVRRGPRDLFGGDYLGEFVARVSLVQREGDRGEGPFVDPQADYDALGA